MIEPHLHHYANKRSVSIQFSPQIHHANMRNGHFALHFRKLRLTAAHDTHVLDGFHQSVVHLTLRDGRQIVMEVVCVEIAVIFRTVLLGGDVLLVLPFFLENEHNLSFFVQKGLQITETRKKLQLRYGSGIDCSPWEILNLRGIYKPN